MTCLSVITVQYLINPSDNNYRDCSETSEKAVQRTHKKPHLKSFKVHKTPLKNNFILIEIEYTSICFVSIRKVLQRNALPE